MDVRWSCKRQPPTISGSSRNDVNLSRFVGQKGEDHFKKRHLMRSIDVTKGNRRHEGQPTAIDTTGDDKVSPPEGQRTSTNAVLQHDARSFFFLLSACLLLLHWHRQGTLGEKGSIDRTPLVLPSVEVLAMRMKEEEGHVRHHVPRSRSRSSQILHAPTPRNAIMLCSPQVARHVFSDFPSSLHNVT